MAQVDVRIVPYQTDLGEDINIRISYEIGLPVSPNERYEDGGFEDIDLKGCAVVRNRRGFTPRFIIKQYGTGNNLTQQRVYVRDLATYQDLLEEDSTIRYHGEVGCKTQLS